MEPCQSGLTYLFAKEAGDSNPLDGSNPSGSADLFHKKEAKRRICYNFVVMKTILFDFFGVLSTPVYKKIIEKFVPENEQAAWIQKLDALDTGELPENELVRQLSEKSNLSESDIWTEVKNTPKINYELFDFIEKNLKGKYKIGLLTNIPRSLIERMVPEKLGMFDLIMISSDLQLIKPSKEIFEVAIQRSGCTPQEILFIDDGEKNIKVAKSLGLNGIVYTDFPSFILELKKII